MQQKMRVRVAAGMLLLLMLTGCSESSSAAGVSAQQDSEPSAVTAGVVSSASDGEIQQAPNGLTAETALTHGLVLHYDKADALLRGDACTLTAAPYVSRGVLYLPASELAVLLGGSSADAQDVWYFNCGGNISVVMPEYNVLLFNHESYVMEDIPENRDGVLYLPADGAAKMLSLRMQLSPPQQLCVLGLSGQLSAGELRRLKTALDGAANPESVNPEIAAAAEAGGISAETAEALALAHRLWQTDADGRITGLSLNAEGTLSRKDYILSQRFPPDTLYTAAEHADHLTVLPGGQSGPKLPEVLSSEELRAASGRFMELSAAAMLCGDTNAAALSAHYREKLLRDTEDEVYRDDLAQPYQTALFAAGTDPEQAWNTLAEHAEAGDYLLFHAETAYAEYGYFNHAALILDKQGDTLHLLHARGSDQGVGADLDMDLLTWELMTSHVYYSDYDCVFLCESGALSPAAKEQMAREAYRKYNGYQFGYGGRLGLDEINCTELIQKAYASAGVEILADDYETRLRDVLRGNTRNLVLIPDDLMLSGRAEVKAVWKRRY